MGSRWVVAALASSVPNAKVVSRWIAVASFWEMSMRLMLSLAVLASALAAAPVAAQGRGRASDSVPKTHLPPPGMCRIWLPNVPPAKQAAPTDCATAVRNRPANGRVIFGDSLSRGGKTAPAVPVLPGTLPIPNVAPTKTKPPPPVTPPPLRVRGAKKPK